MLKLDWKFMMLAIAVLVFAVGSRLYAEAQKIEKPIIIDGHHEVIVSEELFASIRIYYITNKNDSTTLDSIKIGGYTIEKTSNSFSMFSDNKPVYNSKQSNYYGVRYVTFDLYEEELQHLYKNPKLLRKVEYQFSDGSMDIRPLQLAFIEADSGKSAIVQSNFSWGSDGNGEGTIEALQKVEIVDVAYNSQLSHFVLSKEGEPIQLPIKVSKGQTITFQYENMTLIGAIEKPIVTFSYLDHHGQLQELTLWHMYDEQLPIHDLNTYVQLNANK